MDRKTLQHRVFERWMDSRLHTPADRWWWLVYRVFRGWGSLRGVDRNRTAISEIRPKGTDRG